METIIADSASLFPERGADSRKPCARLCGSSNRGLDKYAARYLDRPCSLGTLEAESEEK